MHKYIIVLGTLLLPALIQGSALADTPERPLSGRKYGGRIIDAHNHPNRRSRLAGFFAEVDRAKVEKVIVMVTPNWYRKGKSDKILSESQKHQKAIPLCSADFVGQSFKGRRDEAGEGLRNIARMLDEGRCKGIGELGIRHYDKSRNGKQHEVAIPLDDSFVHQALALADRFAVPIVFHIEPVYKPKDINDLAKIKAWYESVCRRYPRARLIAAHNAMMSPADLEDILLACGNLYADFKFMHNSGSVFGFQDLYPFNDLDFRLFEHWAVMMEEYPNRFLFGSDWKYGRNRGNFDDYSGHIEKVRQIIGSLRQDVQEMVLYTNAKQIFGIK